MSVEAPSSKMEDLDLVRLSQSGDFRAFDLLVERYESRLFTHAMRLVHRQHDSEEVVQQTLLSLVEHLDSFRGESSFYTWLTRIMTNHAFSLLRKRLGKPTLSLTENEEVERQLTGPSSGGPEEIASKREENQLLTDTLDKLDPKYSMVFVLRDREGLTIQETAEALDISPENVKVRLSRAREMVRERFAELFAMDLDR
jgi:RNA polymerase sigma-70 factor (ECF subfamily)